jgi:streptomycin 6-kinase
VGAPQIPDEVSRFVAHYFGVSGRAWLEQLPEVIASTAARWGLEIEHALDGGLLSCVLAARRRDGGPAVLKIAGPWTPARHEALALEHWDGGPAPRLLDFDERLSALLLERIWPGDVPADQPCDQVARLVNALHAAPPTSSQMAMLPSLTEVVQDRFVTAGAEAAARSAADFAALAPRIQRARLAAGELLDDFIGPCVLVHGDLEQRNIVWCQQRGLAAIDPTPCIGDPAYDAAYWAAHGQHAVGLERRCHALALHASLDPSRVLRWASIIALAKQ